MNAQYSFLQIIAARQSVRAMCRLLAVLTCALAATIHAREDPFFLPDNEQDALRLLHNGLLDSTTWFTFSRYYAQPLDVPSGELRHLLDLVPEMQRDIPVSSQDLAPYEPWDGPRVKRFFMDYPALEPYAPILSFGSSSHAHRSRAGLRLYDLYGDPRIAADFVAAPAAWVSSQGSIRFDDDVARWQRRVALVQAPAVARLQLGNFSMPLDNGLFYGYFPEVIDSTLSLADNWAYGATNVWNGVLAQANSPRFPTAAAFFHTRPTESALGIIAGCNATKYVFIYAHASGLVVRDGAPDTLVIGQAGVRLRVAAWSFSLATGLTDRKPIAAPVLLIGSGGIGGNMISLSVAHLPRGLAAPRSRRAQLLDADLACLDSTGTIRDPATAVSANVDRPLGDRATMTLGCASAFSMARSRFDASAGLRGSSWCEYHIRYVFRPDLLNDGRSHQWSVSAQRSFAGEWLVRLSSSGLADAKPSASGSLKGMLAWTPSPATTIGPEFSGYWRLGEPAGYAVGIQQILRLFDRTETLVRVLAPLVSSTLDEGPFLYAKMSFSF
jgi:hypothetical protein